MDRGRRAEELNSLRLVVATFALRLDAFEARLKGHGGCARRAGYWRYNWNRPGPGEAQAAYSDYVPLSGRSLCGI